MSAARDEVLGRIREAIAADRREEVLADYGSIGRTYLRTPRFDRDERLRVFASRLEDYDCGVHTTKADSVPATISDVLVKRGVRRLVTPREFPAGVLPANLDVRCDDRLPAREIETYEGVITCCTVAIAFTGTIVLSHSGAEGRRVLTLLPDYHLCLVREEQIVDSLPEALARLPSPHPTLITTISGPSATADIEMTRIRGVHGPRTLDVVIVTG